MCFVLREARIPERLTQSVEEVQRSSKVATEAPSEEKKGYGKTESSNQKNRASLPKLTQKLVSEGITLMKSKGKHVPAELLVLLCFSVASICSC